MKYLLIGGDGVFAIHLAKRLLGQGHEVIRVGRNPPKPDWYSLKTGGHYHQIHLVFEQDRLRKLIVSEKPDYIVNFAALAYATSWTDADRYYMTNVVAPVQLCEWLLDKDYSKFIQIGTSELYGSCDSPADENAPLKSTSPYAVSKEAFDRHLLTMKTVGLRFNILRPSNAYGEGQQIWRVIPKAAWCAVTGNKLPLEGGGMVEKSYIHASDLASAIQLVAENAPSGEVYNCGPELPTKIRDVVGLIAGLNNIPFESMCEMKPGRVGEDARYWLNSDKIKSLGWEPNVSLDYGLMRMLDWARTYSHQLKGEEQRFVLRA